MRKRHVLLPQDGSEFGRRAFRAVGRLFDPAITRVTLLHVARPPEGVGTPPPRSIALDGGVLLPRDDGANRHPIFQSQVWASLRAELLTAMDDDAERLREAGYDVDVAVRFGDPAQELADCVEEGDIDAVVMATHGRSGISRAVLGSVAERLLRMVIVPVIMVRPHDDTPDPTPLAPLG
jgi:nucleotide-binding universal stress UspA family protein